MYIILLNTNYLNLDMRILIQSEPSPNYIALYFSKKCNRIQKQYKHRHFLMQTKRKKEKYKLRTYSTVYTITNNARFETHYLFTKQHNFSLTPLLSVLQINEAAFVCYTNKLS